MAEIDRIAALIRGQLPNVKSGSLRIWGQWFGRPYDNLLSILDATARAESLLLHFNCGELLQIDAPRNVIVESQRFVVRDAERVRWEWNKYGNPPGRRYYQEYVRRGDHISADTDVDWYHPILQPCATEAAVEIL
jgi:hypothetical protein